MRIKPSAMKQIAGYELCSFRNNQVIITSFAMGLA